MSDASIVVCPADGCDYEGVRKSVCAHYSGKGDDTHKGGYERAKALLGSEGDSGGSQEAQSKAKPSGGSSSSGENPAFSSPKADTSKSSGSSSESGCPECGSDRFALVSDHTDMIPEEYHDYEKICADCKELY